MLILKENMIFTIIIVTLFVAAIASAIILSQDYEKYLKRVEQTMEEAKESFMKPLSVALYSEDEDQVNNALNGILKLEGLVEVRIVNVGEKDPSFSAVTSKKDGKYKKMKAVERRSLGPSREIKIIHVDPDDPDSKGEQIATMFLNSTKEVARDKIINQIQKFASLRSKSLTPSSKQKKLTFTVGAWALPYLKLLKQTGLIN